LILLKGLEQPFLQTYNYVTYTWSPNDLLFLKVNPPKPRPFQATKTRAPFGVPGRQ